LSGGRILSGVALIFIGIAGALVIAELGLRLIGYADPRFYVRDDEVGFALRPGAAGWFTHEGRSYVTINSAGRHDSDVRLSKPPQTIRIAVLGDSFTEAKQVPIEQNFSSVIQHELPKCSAASGERVEVMNFGVAGYGTAQELIMLRDRVWQYSPDIVVLAFYTGNDVLDNSPTLGQTRLRPFFIRRDGEWEIDDSFREQRHYRDRLARQSSFGTWLRDRVRLIQLLEEVRRIVVRRIADTDESAAEANDSSWLLNQNAPKNIDVINMMFGPPRTPELRDAWDATEYLLDTMNREVKAHKALFLVVTLSDAIQVYPDPALRDAVVKKYEIENLFYPDKRVESFGRSHGIEVLSLAEPFQRYADAHKVYLHGFTDTYLGYGHWNSAGHRLAGEMIEDRLCEMLDHNLRN
jgi:lysophospholipase L1-like esterase